MSLSQEKMDLIHKGMIETVQEFTKICEENNLRYLMTGGTLIGAVRHQGFIPWDDDMDIFMPREDYERFLEIANDVLPCNLKANHYSNVSEPCLYVVIKLNNENYEIIREQYGKQRATKLFVDIFPLDGFPQKKAPVLLHKLRLKYRYMMIRLARLQIHNQDSDYKKNRSTFEKIVYKINKILHISEHMDLNKQIYKYEKVLKKYPYRNSEKVFFASGPYGMFKEIYPKELFENVKLYKFENIELKGVVDYDRHLRQVYGDYMQLPPEEDRICLHIKDIKYVGGEKNVKS